jgi:hypothetical protein
VRIPHELRLVKRTRSGGRVAPPTKAAYWPTIFYDFVRSIAFEGSATKLTLAIGNDPPCGVDGLAAHHLTTSFRRMNGDGMAASGREAAVRRNVRSWGVKPTSRSHSRTSGFDPGCVKTPLLWYDSLVILRGKLMRRFVEEADRGQWTLLPECLDDFIDESNLFA